MLFANGDVTDVNFQLCFKLNTSEYSVINVTQFGLHKLTRLRNGSYKCVNDCYYLQVTLNWTFKSSVLIEILMSAMPSCFLH